MVKKVLCDWFLCDGIHPRVRLDAPNCLEEALEGAGVIRRFDDVEARQANEWIYRRTWRYEAEFTLPAQDKRAFLRLTGLNGRWSVLVNEAEAANGEGDSCEFEITALLSVPNRIELQHLSGLPCNTDGEISAASKALLDKGLQSIAVSLGSRGCYYADREGRSFFRMLKPVADMANATGAGDAFMAGLACAFVRGASPEDMVDYALACGLLAVQSEDTINPQLSDETVRKTLQEQHI